MTFAVFECFDLGLAISLTPPASSLGVEVPPSRFLVSHQVMKLILQIINFVAFQFIALYLLSQQEFYVKYETDDPLSESYSYEASTISNIALAQIMIASVVSSIGKPFRKPWFTNKFHVAALFVQILFLLYQLFSPENKFTKNILSLRPIPTSFATMLVALILANIFVSFVLTSFVDYLYRMPAPLRIRRNVEKHNNIFEDMEQDERTLLKTPHIYDSNTF